MAEYVLIHGSWQGAWVWDDVVHGLRAAGHGAHAPDLPAHGADPARPDEVDRSGYVDRVVGVLDTLDTPAIVVGHSHGGVVLAEVCEARPDAVALAVYLCAYLPSDGQALLDLATRPEGRESMIMPNLEFADDGTATVRSEVLAETFFGGCSATAVADSIARLRPEPMSSPSTPVHTTAERFGRVRRAYVACTEDRAVPIELQRAMVRDVPCETYTEIEASHAPMMAVPDVLVGCLEDLAEVAASDRVTPG